MIRWIQNNWFYIAMAGLVVVLTTFLFGEQVKALFTSKIQEKQEEKEMPIPFPLKRGSAGPYVTSLQKFLNASDSSYKLTTDGVFGAATEAAVVSEITGIPGITNPKEVPQWYYDSNIKGKY